uniref:F-box domain-containing protein n=1 Tax=Culex tarsalis TaxID=7177 RepID=A0A1Q3EZ61_CULTA
MEESKERVIYLAVFDDLPNEILWQIFRQLKHPDLLRMSLVCRRWNQVIFHFLNHRFRFLPKQAEQLCPDRSFKHLDLSACPLPVPNLNIKRFDYFFTTASMVEFLSADQVTSLEMRRKDSHVDLLTRLLVTFKNLTSLVWNVPGKMLSYYKVPKTEQRFVTSYMAHVQHFTLFAKSKKMMGFVEKLSEHLVTLSVTVSHESLFELCECSANFPNLKTFRLKVNSTEQLNLQSALKEFLQKLPKLRKFAFGTNDEYLLQEVTEAETNIEEFEIFGFQDLTCPALFLMKSLRTFRADGTVILGFYENETPSPQITFLDIDQTMVVSVDALVEIFPNLTRLRMSSRVNSVYEMLRLLVTYPELEDLAIRIADGHGLSTILMLIVRILKQLRELKINLTLPDEAAEEFPKLIDKIFDVVLETQTLQKFYITSDVQLYGDEQLVLPSKNHNCQVYWNDVLMKRV